MHLLHLVGATTTRFYHDLSLTYHSETLTPEGMTADVLRVAPDGSLHLRRAGEGEGDIDFGAVADLAARADLVVPFMFCPAGMTVWRDLFETIFGVPVVGPPLAASIVATSKWQTKAIAEAAGVRVPRARLLEGHDRLPQWTGPCIVKPDAEDNSIGLSLVHDETDFAAAVSTARRHGTAVLVEDYVPGREIRVGLLDLDGALSLLPVLEYHMTADHPIRVRADKVDVDEDGAVTKNSWAAPSLETSCPAAIEPARLADIATMARNMHRALGARDYSLYDFRIHAGTGEPYLLEACSFWTFAPMSIISRMVRADGRDLEAVTRAVFEQAAGR